MSDLRKWLKIMESVPSVFPDQPSPERLIKKDATVMVNPNVGGGTGRYMHSTPNGAMIDIKGVARELSEEDFSLPERDYEDPYQKGNDWFHMSTEPDTPGRMNDKPEFRPGDMVKIADVYGAVIGPGFGVFVGYGTTGEDCIVLFDGKQIVVPVENVAAVLEQDAKNNFDDMDNDGNLSPMSFGSDNVKVEEPAMDQRDEFSKWMSAVEEALSSEGKELAEDTPCMTNECGCGSWDCPTCFPSQDEMPGLNGTLDGIGGVNPEQAIVIGGVDVPGSTPDARQFRDDPFAAPTDIGIDLAQNDIEADYMMGLEEVGMFDEDEDAIAAFIAGGGQVQQLPYRNRPRNPGQEFGSKHIGSASGRETSKGALRGRAANVSLPDNPSQKPIVGEEENEFIEKPKSGKGVKLGDIIHKTEFRKTGGQNSPMTYGEENLGEGPDDMSFDEPDYDADPMAVRMAQDEMSQIDPDEALDMISTIKYMDSMGLSKSPKSYSEDQMAQMTANQLRKYHAEVMGDVAEATRPTKTRTQDFNLDDMDDILNPGAANLPANVDAPQGFDDEPVDSPAASLPTASASSTASKLRGLTGTEQMRDLMGRMDRGVGATEPDRPPVTDVVVRTASDVPAVVNSAMQASGMQSPEWHLISNLPGMNDRAIRAVGRGVFNLMTTTPVEEIKTIANLGGQGPNTDAEMRAVAGWLRDNAEDLGPSQVDHSRVMPGYNPEAHDYRANGVKFHVVKDQSGVYIYAWPDSTSKRLGGPAGQAQLGQGGNTPRLRESEEVLFLRPTLFEQLKWDEEINAILAETIVEEELLDESSLSKMLGKQKGGQNLVRWMHNKHKLSNEANLVPAPFSERLLWKEFKANPDNFVIVSATDGVAGVKPYEKFIKDRTEEFRKKGKTYNPSGDSTLPYQIIAFTDDGQQVDPALLRQPTAPGEEPEERHPDPTVMKARMGKISGKDMQNPNNTFNLLADQIGTLKTVWVASGAVERDKMKNRADMKVEPDVDEMGAMTKIFKRVRPVLKTLGMQALSQINNRAKRYIDGGNFEGAQKVAASGNKLKQFLTTIDTSGDVALTTAYGAQNKSFTDQLAKAIVQASGAGQGSPEYLDYLRRASSGSAMELKPLLDALRDNLVSLT